MLLATVMVIGDFDGVGDVDGDGDVHGVHGAAAGDGDGDGDGIGNGADRRQTPPTHEASV